MSAPSYRGFLSSEQALQPGCLTLAGSVIGPPGDGISRRKDAVIYRAGFAN